MRRTIVHMIRGEAEKVHRSITNDLVDNFDSYPIHDRVPPHLTLKRWFELNDEDMSVLHKTLDEFVATQKQSDYALKGFSHFAKDVIYIDVVPSKETLTCVKDLKMELHKIENLTFDEYDDLDNDLHVTVAMSSLKAFDFDPMWKYLNELPQPNFKMKFDNITILKKTDKVWEVEHSWELEP